MAAPSSQLDLFRARSHNPTYELKRQLRIALAEIHLSRDEVVDRMNAIACREGMRKTISKNSLDNWTKDSDPDRLPSAPWLTIFCEVVGNLAPLDTLCAPLGGKIVSPDQAKLLAWAEAELAKKKAARRARLALEELES